MTNLESIEFNLERSIDMIKDMIKASTKPEIKYAYERCLGLYEIDLKALRRMKNE